MNLTAEKIRRFQRHFLDGVVRRTPNLGLARRAENFVKLFENYLPPASRILDIGGGWGFYAEPLTRRGHQVTLVDVVRPGFQKAPVVVYDGRRFPFPDRSFDVSLVITALHHMSDPEAVLREARRVTRKMVVVVEDIYHHALGKWWTKLRDQIYNFEFFGHAGSFKKREEWLALFSRLRFSLLEERQLFTWLAGLRILNGVFILKVRE